MKEGKTLTIAPPRAGCRGPLTIELDGVPILGVQRMKLGTIEGHGILNPGDRLIATIQVEVQIAGAASGKWEKIPPV